MHLQKWTYLKLQNQNLKCEAEQRKGRISCKCLAKHCSDTSPMQGVT